MFEPVPTQANLIPSEHDILAFWRQNDTFNKLRKKNEHGKPWSFLDGPITANNPMGVHHAWGRTLKDCFQRYHAMLGQKQRYQNGFDCQGLWVEVEVEKDLGFKTKRDIENFGVARFVEKCKERVRKYSAIQTQQSIRLGFWMDWDNSYYTMADENNYTIWQFLKKCHKRGLVYKGADVMPWCPRCGTGISQHEMHEGYKEVADPSVFVTMPLRESPALSQLRKITSRTGDQKISLLVWTTTPWTLAANVACAVHPDLLYSLVEQNGHLYVLGRNCVAQMKGQGDCRVLADVPGRQLIGLTYDGPFDDLPAESTAREAHRVIAWPAVSDTEGTGVVHIAPGCGKEDYDLGIAENLPAVAPLDESGVYVAGFGPLTGQFAGGVKQLVYDNLKAKGLFYKGEQYVHSYPHCWRCATPLLFRHVNEWYIKMSWRDEIKHVAKQVRWIPEWGLDRELEWLDNMRDWMISKKRYWGLALPVYECECGWFDVIGGPDELEQRAVEGWAEFAGHSPHRPWIDAVKIKCEHCGKPVSRIKDVGNPWLDAGIVAYSTTNYNSDREYWKQWIPADLVTECFPGQFRNWFYAMLAMSTMMENVPPFKTLLGHALVRDEKGEEMHKSAGNAIWFEDAAEKMGVDVMRWAFCRVNPVNNLNFGYKVGQEIERKVFNTLWNVYAFLANYARLDGFDPARPQVPVAERQDIDRWLLSNLQLLVKRANQAFTDYTYYAFIEQAERFIEDLSNWYVRRNRRRFWRSRDENDRDKLAAYQTLYAAVVTLCKLLAPVVPFVTERIYQNLARGAGLSRGAGFQPVDKPSSGTGFQPVTNHGQDGRATLDTPESVHLCEYPQADESLIDEPLSKQMNAVTDVVSIALGIRAAKQLRVRQPLSEVIVAAADPDVRAGLERFKAHLLDELNVKSLMVREDPGNFLDYEARLDMTRVGPRLGAKAGRVSAEFRKLASEDIAASLELGEGPPLDVDGEEVILTPDDIVLKAAVRGGYAGPEDFEPAKRPDPFVLLNVQLTPELVAEGLARDVVRHVQQLRKDANLEMNDRIQLRYDTGDDTLASAIESWAEYITRETLADTLHRGLLDEPDRVAKIGGSDLKLSISRA